MAHPTHALLAGAILLGCAGTGWASTQTLAYYRLGDDDPGAHPLMLGQDPTLDSGPSKLNLSRFGSPHYSDDVAKSAAIGTGSLLSMRFDAQTLDAYYRLGPVTKLTDDVGIEAWVKTTADPTAPGQSVVAYNGMPGADGFGLLRVAGPTPFGGLESAYVGKLGNTTIGFSAVPAGQWVDLALVRAGGQTTFYVDGQPDGTTTLPASAATQTFTIGASYCALCLRPVPTADYLNGLVDEVRVFSFPSGEFKPASDLLFRSQMGDANGDGRVDFSDFNILAGNFGKSGVGFAGGDFNHDGIVDFADFNLLIQNFGQVLTPVQASDVIAFGRSLAGNPAAQAAVDAFAARSAGVPEPSAIILLLFGSLAIGRRRRLI